MLLSDVYEPEAFTAVLLLWFCRSSTEHRPKAVLYPALWSYFAVGYVWVYSQI